jgi:RHS repeat-associated protein
MFSMSSRRFHSLLALAALLPLLLITGSSASSNTGAPVAGNDSYTIHGCALPLNPPLVANDFDPDGDPLAIIAFPQQPAHGSIIRGEGNTVGYCATSGYVGADSFTYTVCDNHGGCGTGSVSLDDVNQAPNGGADSYNVHGSTVIGPFLANDSDPDGDTLSCGGFGHECILTSPQHGSLSGLPQPDKKTYNPAAGYTGPDSFTYNACDNWGLCTATTVTLSVNNGAPTASDHLYRIQGSTIIGPLLQGASDPDGDPLHLGDGGTFPTHGQLFGTATPDLKMYNPFTGFVGTDSYTYQVCDNFGACSPLATITLSVIGDGSNLGVSDDCQMTVGEPVNVTNGNMYLQQNDYQLPSVGYGITTTRTYNSASQGIGLFGRGWSTAYDESIVAYDNNLVRFNQSDGRAIYFARPVGSSGVFAPLIGDVHAQLTQNGSGFTLVRKDGSVEQFGSSGKLLSLADRNGNTTSLTYGGNGFLSSVIDPVGRALTITTNASGLVTSISDTMGTVATYTYGASSQLLSVTYADNSAFQFSYDGNFRLTAATDALGNIVEAHTYDGQGRALTSEKHGGVERYTLTYVNSTRTDVTDALGHVTKYTYDTSKGRNVVTQVEGLCSCGGSQLQTWTYDSQLNETSATDALNHVTSYTYDTNGNRLTQTDATGTVTYTYNGFGQVLTRMNQMNGVTTNIYDASGNLSSTSDALNNTTSFTYNARGQMLTATDARGKVTNFTYDTSGNLTQRRDANSITTFFFYDARSRLTKVRDGLSRSTLFAYDLAGRINKVTHPDLSFVSFTYDLAGRRTRVTDERGNQTNYAFDSAYRLTSVTDAANHATSYGYDLMSNRTSMTDALLRATDYEYDDFNRLKKITYPPAEAGATRLFETLVYDDAGNVTSRTDTAGRVTSYGYDNVNRITSTTDAANKTTSFQYDELSRITSLTDAINQQYQFVYDALGRQTEITRGGVTMSYDYDEVGNRTQRTDYNGVVTNYSYDNLNRLTTITYPSRTVTYAYDPLNNITRATNENGSVYISYDNRYRVSSFSDPFYYGISYNYDTAGNRTKLKVNGATYATYTYDAVNRLTNLADSASLNFIYNYDAANRLTSRSAPNGVTSSYAYDGLDRLTSLMHTAGATTLSGNLYTYNNANNISSWTTASDQKAYTYDAVDRLTNVTNYEMPAENYSYDGVGNRTASHLSASYSYQPFNKLTSTASATYSYDNNGNLISKTDASGTTTVTFNEENQLTQVALPNSLTVNYKYDGLGRRIQRTTSAGANERYIYDKDDVLIDLNADWSVSTTYLNDLRVDGHVRQTSSATGVTYFLADHLSSTVSLTDSSGSLLEQNAYDSFGNGTGSGRTRYGYTGRERDPDTGMLHYRARFYDPQNGRFVSEDPIGFNAGVNFYAYVSNNPVAWTDALGLCPCTCTLQLRANRIEVVRGYIPTPGYHLYITTTDSCTGKFRGYRAGPGDQNKIEAIAGPFDKEFEDFPGHEDDRIVVSLKIPGSCEKWDRSFTETTDLVNLSQIEYTTLEQNSNAFAYTALGRAGVRPAGLTDALNRTIPTLGTVPGWGVVLPYRMNLPALKRR